MEGVTVPRAVYVGAHATLDQVRAAVAAWQKQSGDTTYLRIEPDGDGYPGMGYAIDFFVRDDTVQAAIRDRLAEGITPLLPGVRVATDTELDKEMLAGS